MPLFENLGKIINDKDVDYLKSYYDFTNKDDIVADDLVEIYMNPLFPGKNPLPGKSSKENKDDEEDYEEGSVEHVLNYIFEACNEGEINDDEMEKIYEMVDDSEPFQMFVTILNNLSKKIKNKSSLKESSEEYTEESIEEIINPIYEPEIFNVDDDEIQIEITI